MEFLPPRQAIWFKAKKSILFLLLSSVVWIIGKILWLIEETSKHRIFSWLNEEVDRRAGPMIERAIKWLTDNPISFFEIVGVAYCVIVIIGAQLSYSRSKKKKLLIIELRSGLNNIGKSGVYGRILDIQSLALAKDELYNWHDKATRTINRLFGQDEAKKLIYIKDAYTTRLLDDFKSFFNEKESYREYLLLGA
jgi:hypothetical protein